MGEYYYGTVSRESRLREYEQEWASEVRSIREQLIELGLSTEAMDYILKLLPSSENPNAKVGEITWI